MNCPHCGSDEVIKNGWRYNQSERKQRWLCSVCKNKFTYDDGFWKMKNKPETVAEAIDLYESGNSLDETANHLWKHHAIQISATSVRNWIIKYGQKIRSVTETMEVKKGKRIHEDEVEFKVNGQRAVFWRAKDAKTGFKFSGPVGRRSKENCMRLGMQIKKQCYKVMRNRKEEGKPIRFVSDRLPQYRIVFNKIFRNVCHLTFGIPIKAKKKGLRYNNNEIEGEHPKVNLRIRHMRGVDNLTFIKSVLHLQDDLDNFTRYRNKKRKTPAERAGIKLDLGRNKTLNLIYFLGGCVPQS
jgi:transposase-like protein